MTSTAETVKQYTKRHCRTREDKDALQEIVHGARLTTEGPRQGLQGEQELDVQKPALSLEVVLTKDCITDTRARDIGGDSHNSQEAATRWL